MFYMQVEDSLQEWRRFIDRALFPKHLSG